MTATLRLTDDLATALANSVAQGVPIETAAQAAGFDPRTVYRWLQIARDGVRDDGANVTDASFTIIGRFGRLVARAQAEWEAHQVTAIGEDAARFNEKTGQRDWRARAWLLNNHPRTRARYRQERQLVLEHSGTIQHEHSLANEADDAQLRAWAALELPAPIDQPPVLE